MWIIFVGLANFMLYIAGYVWFYGEAIYGHVEVGGEETRYFLQSGEEVSRGVFLYSGIHSISIWPTVGAIMLAMLTLAKDRIVEFTRGHVAGARVLITVIALLIGLSTALATFEFARTFADKLDNPDSPPPATRTKEAAP